MKKGQQIEDDYQLSRDRERIVHRPPTRYGYADFSAFALAAAEEIDNLEPVTY